MPVNYKDYPKDWEAISLRIRRDRAKNRCEQCNVPNHMFVTRDGYKWKSALPFVRPFWRHDEENERNGYAREWGNPHDIVKRLKEDGHAVTYVVLTVAHIGAPKPDGSPGDKQDKHDVRDENLKALCQRCHRRLDHNDHMTNRRFRRNWRRDQTRMEI